MKVGDRANKLTSLSKILEIKDDLISEKMKISVKRAKKTQPLTFLHSFTQ